MKSFLTLDVMMIGLGLASFLLPFHTLEHLFECLILRNKQIKYFSKILQKGYIVLNYILICSAFSFSSHFKGVVVFREYVSDLRSVCCT